MLLNEDISKYYDAIKDMASNTKVQELSLLQDAMVKLIDMCRSVSDRIQEQADSISSDDLIDDIEHTADKLTEYAKDATPPRVLEMYAVIMKCLHDNYTT